MNDGDRIEYWVTDKDLEAIFSAKYWNDEEKEKEKEYNISDRNDHKLLEYLKVKTTFYDEFCCVMAWGQGLGIGPSGTGIDLAAGVCWTTSLLSRIKEVDRIYAIEISKHRLFKIAPMVMDMFEAEKDKVIRVLGSFYDIRLPDHSIDFCIMSQAFHHAHSPEKLISELKRVLKPGAVVFLIGESPVYPIDMAKRFLKNTIKIVTPFVKWKTRPIIKPFPRLNDLFPTDRQAGDNYYRIGDYKRLFGKSGFQLTVRQTKGIRKFSVFLAIKEM